MVLISNSSERRRSMKSVMVVGATGAGVEILTKGERVKIPSETRLTFSLEKAVRIP